MTSFPASHLRRGGSGSPSDRGQPGVLLRVPVHRGWTKDLPPAPPGLTVTVSLSSPSADTVHGEGLRFLGYHVVEPSGVQGTTGAVADFVVPAGAAGHPAWWEALTRLADRAFPLAFGPVLVTLERALRPHRAHWPADRS